VISKNNTDKLCRIGNIGYGYHKNNITHENLQVLIYNTEIDISKYIVHNLQFVPLQVERNLHWSEIFLQNIT